MHSNGMAPNVGVGVGVIILKDGRILLGERAGAHGAGKWAWPGGHLEWGTSFAQCAHDEVREETGMKIKNPRVATVTNDIFPEDGKHYVTICIIADWESGEPERLEPDKCAQWKWFKWTEFPAANELFTPVAHVVAQSGFHPFALGYPPAE